MGDGRIWVMWTYMGEVDGHGWDPRGGRVGSRSGEEVTGSSKYLKERIPKRLGF